MFKPTKHLIVLFIMAAVVLTIPGVADAQSKRPLNHDDYDNWVTIRGSGLSPDGQWVFYSTGSRNDDQTMLTVKNIDDNNIYQGIAVSGTPQFTYDSKYLIYNLAPPKEEEEKATEEEAAAKEEEKPAPKPKLTLLRLEDGEITYIEKVQSFRLPAESGDWLAYIEEKPEKEGETGAAGGEAQAGRGGRGGQRAGQRAGQRGGQRRQISESRGGGGGEADTGDTIILKSLADDRIIKLEHVASYQFTTDGSKVIYTAIDKDNPDQNGVFVFNPDNDEKRPLLTGKGEYSGFTFDDDQEQYALLTTRDDPEPNDAPLSIYGGNLDRGRARLWVSAESTDGFPENMAIGRGVSFQGDNAITFTIDYDAETKKKMKEEFDKNKDQSEANFELWHWNDPYPYPQQKSMVSQMQRTSRSAILHLDSRVFAVLTDDKITSVSYDDNATIAVANDRTPYTKMSSYDGSYNDVYVVDTETGDRRQIKEMLRASARLSPNGKYLTWFVEDNYYVHDIANRITTNITENLDVNFYQEDHDTPDPAGGYGIAGWTDDDETILLNDKYDIWEMEPDGSNARRITEGFGRENDLSFRITRIGDTSRSSTVDPDETLMLKTTNMETMAQGFYRDRISGDQLPRRLIMLDQAIGNPRKAENANRYMFTRSSYEEFPDIWVSDTRFGNMKKVSDVGKQLDQFIWGKAELRDFASSDGKPLKGILIKPENFDPANKYPLMIYIYETLHNGLHSFKTPNIGTSINLAYYVSNGYVVWQPDIEYDTGYPGPDSLKCVLPGIQMLIGEGYINPKAIGIQGHSWGGYQISYMVTQTNIFAAAEAGAPVSNMTSAYGGIRWASGMVRQFQYEMTQSRLGASPWEVPLRYLENSPIFWADKVQTPLLILHNDQDGAVPWYQGIEYIMALRRLNKVAFMFNYVGEDHGLRQRENQRDFTIRMQQFFDHYLKGDPAPKWMTEGIQAWKK